MIDPLTEHSLFRRRLVAVLALGIAIRATYLATTWSNKLRLNDSIWYNIVAYELSRGNLFRSPVLRGETAEHPPLTSIVMVPGSWFGTAVHGQRVTTAVCGVVTIALVGLLARRVGGDRVGIVAALLAAIYPNIWLSDGLVMSESLALMLVTAVVLATVRLLDNPSTRLAVVAGALAGLAALTRSEQTLLVVLVAVAAFGPWRTRTKAGLARSAVVALGAVIVMAPWLLFNLSRFERPVLLTTNDGTTLLGSNCDDIYSGANKGGWSVFCVLNAPPVSGDDSIRSSAQRKLAVRYVRDHVAEVPGVVVARIGRALDLYGLSDLVHSDVGEERPRPWVWAGVVGWWLLAPLAAFGLVVVQGVARRALRMPIIVAAATAILFYGSHRLRSPMEPMVVILAAVALCHLWRRRRSPDGGGDHPRNALDTDVGELTVP